MKFAHRNFIKLNEVSPSSGKEKTIENQLIHSRSPSSGKVPHPAKAIINRMIINNRSSGKLFII